MRIAFVLLLAAAASWCAAVDWRATIGQGNAYRLSSLGDGLARVFPDSGFIGGLAGSTAGAVVLALPLAVLLAAVAFGLWITRPRTRGR